tara:strand:- start:1266 stop:1439 length:174 start_codon:yes stop_codon:yes gene_type:complete
MVMTDPAATRFREMAVQRSAATMDQWLLFTMEVVDQVVVAVAYLPDGVMVTSHLIQH